MRRREDVIWLDVYGHSPGPRAAAERTRSRRQRSGGRRNKRLHNVGRFLTDVVVRRRSS